jgi:hypothetical protein
MDQVLDVVAGPDRVLGDLGLRGASDMGTKLKNLSSLKETYAGRFAETKTYEDLKGYLAGAYKELAPEPGRPLGEKLGADVAKAPGLVSGALYGKTPAELDRMGLGAQLVTGFEGALHTIKLLAFPAGVEVGKDVAAGLKVGINSGHGEVKDAGAGLGTGAVEGAREATDSHSPSRLFKRIGMDVGDGFVLGLEGSRRGIEAMANDVFAIDSRDPSTWPALKGQEWTGRLGGAGGFEIAPPGLDAGALAGAGGAGGVGGVTVNIGDIVIEGHAGEGGAELGQAVTNELRTLLPSALIDVFEQVSISAGCT